MLHAAAWRKVRAISVQNHASAFNSLWGLGNRRVAESHSRDVATFLHAFGGSHILARASSSLFLFKGIAACLPACSFPALSSWLLAIVLYCLSFIRPRVWDGILMQFLCAFLCAVMDRPRIPVVDVSLVR